MRLHYCGYRLRARGITYVAFYKQTVLQHACKNECMLHMYLFYWKEFQQWENEMPVQKVGDFGGQIVFRHVDYGRGRASNRGKLYLIQCSHSTKRHRLHVQVEVKVTQMRTFCLYTVLNWCLNIIKLYYIIYKKNIIE